MHLAGSRVTLISNPLVAIELLLILPAVRHNAWAATGEKTACLARRVVLNEAGATHEGNAEREWSDRSTGAYHSISARTDSPRVGCCMAGKSV